MAVAQRRPAEGVISRIKAAKYTSVRFGSHCRDPGVALSMGSVGDCFDNAMAESFFACRSSVLRPVTFVSRDGRAERGMGTTEAEG